MVLCTTLGKRRLASLTGNDRQLLDLLGDRLVLNDLTAEFDDLTVTQVIERGHAVDRDLGGTGLYCYKPGLLLSWPCSSCLP